jgi:ArsR family transcriptional regulator
VGADQSETGKREMVIAGKKTTNHSGKTENEMNRAQIERISKALGDQTRLRIFEAISSCDEMNCGQIIKMQGVTPATVSHHLKTLADARLIECRREGQFVYNKAIPEAMDRYLRSLSVLVRKQKNKKHR